MIKFWEKDTSITFSEIPHEISLCFNITQCPNNCEGCSEPYLRENIGEELTPEIVDHYINDNVGATCVLFMGGDNDPKGISDLCKHIKENHERLKTAWYSGKDKISKDIEIKYFDFIKVGHWDEFFGPLNKRTTNQILYKIEDDDIKDITYKFWKD